MNNQLGVDGGAGGSSPHSTNYSAKSPSMMSSTAPAAGPGGHRRASLGRRMSVAAVDVSGFSAANFQPEFYLQFSMEDDTPEAIYGVRKTLEISRDKVVHDLQKTVYGKFGEFVQISKELSGFESKINELHGIINQLGSLSETLLANVPQCSEAAAAALAEEPSMESISLPILDGAAATAAVAGVDLAERRAKISRILEHVSDLEEFLSEAAGRHILFEGADLLFTPETPKGQKPIYLYLLNDCLIGTAKKVSRNPLGASGKKKYGVEFKTMLADLHYEDIKESTTDSHGVTHWGLRLLEGRSKVIGSLQFDSLPGKKLWIDQLKKAIIGFKMEEAAKNATLHLQPVKERYAKKANRSSLAVRAGHRRAASSSAHRKAAEHAVATAGISDLPKDKYRRLLNLLDDLDQASFVRKYGEATDFVEQVAFNLDQLAAAHSDSPRMHGIKHGLDLKKRKLAELLLAEISCPFINKAETVNYVQLLLVLGYADAAREKFLTARSDMLARAITDINCVGSLEDVVTELTLTMLAGIKTAAEWYKAAFVDPIRMSGLVFWIRIELTNFCGLLSRLLFSSNTIDYPTAGKCIALARSHVQSLQEAGLSFIFLVDDCLAKPISAVMTGKSDAEKASITALIKADKFDKFVAYNQLQVPESAHQISQVIDAFSALHSPLLHADLAYVLASQLVILLESACSGYIDRFHSKDSTPTTNQNVVLSLEYLIDSYFPALYSGLSDKFQQDFPAMKRLHMRLISTLYAMYDILTEISASSWLPSDWQCYQVGQPGDSAASQWVMQLLPQLSRLVKEAPAHRHARLLKHLANSILEGLAKALDADIRFTHPGLDQFLIDTEFIGLVICLQDPTLLEQLTQLRRKALHHAGMAEPDKPSDWYSTQAYEFSRSIPPTFTDFGLN